MRPPATTVAAGGSTSGGDNVQVAAVDKSQKGKKVVEDIWMSKDRFGAKRLSILADNLSPAKKQIIQSKSAFRALLNVAQFRIPNELTDFVATHTSSRLREYKLRKNQMVFTTDMVRKVFGIRCGRKPIDLSITGGAELDDIRALYHGGKKREELATAINILKNCADTDEETIIRTWDLVSLATVVAPKSSNHVNLEYVGLMADPTKTDEYAWDEHLLGLLMQTVSNIQKKKKKQAHVLPKDCSKFEFWITGPFILLGIAYMDHLDFPPCDHTFDKSLPRVCSVKTSDFTFVVQHDSDRKILSNKTVFGRRDFLPLSATPYGTAPGYDDFNKPAPVEDVDVNPSASLNEWLNFPSSQDLQVPARFKTLYEKHKAIFEADVDVTMKNLSAGLKRMQAQRMAALLVDVESSSKEEEAGPSVVFPTKSTADDDDQLQDDDGSETEDDEKEPEDHGVDAAAAKDTDGDVDDVVEKGGAADASMEQGGPVATKHADAPQAAIIIDSMSKGADATEQPDVVSPDRSPIHSPRKDISDEAWANAPDKPPFDLFEPGTDEYAEFCISQSLPPSCDAPTGAVTTASDASESIPASPSTLVDLAPFGSTEPATHAVLIAPVVVNIESSVKGDGSSGLLTHEKKTRFKRAAKEELTPPKLKKMKVSEDVEQKYSTFVMNGRKFKSHPKDRAPPVFVEIGRYYCCYRTFQTSLRPRQNLDSELMNVWIEKFNHESDIVCKKSARKKRKYAFTQHFVEKLIVDPKAFNAKACMDELKEQNAKFKIFKCDLLYFPIVKFNHWAVPCINLVAKQMHIFDSMKGSKNASVMDDCARNLVSNPAILVHCVCYIYSRAFFFAAYH
uniref:Uncharacterized protein n=1 Tax=Avena sativa TaxID=4498 RepID=A0ACD5ZU07_AVESA